MVLEPALVDSEALAAEMRDPPELHQITTLPGERTTLADVGAGLGARSRSRSRSPLLDIAMSRTPPWLWRYWLTLPDGLALGRSVSHGFGWFRRIAT